MDIKLQWHEGGRKDSSFPRENYDCTVKALVAATGFTYNEAHALAEKHGRCFGGGMNNPKIESMLMSLNSRPEFEVSKLYVEPSTWGSKGGRRARRHGGITVVKFLATLPSKGSFYLTSTQHAFAVVDGVVLESNHRLQRRAKMDGAYRIRRIEANAVKQSDISAMWERLNRIESRLND